jgi:hypothetical protein
MAVMRQLLGTFIGRAIDISYKSCHMSGNFVFLFRCCRSIRPGKITTDLTYPMIHINQNSKRNFYENLKAQFGVQRLGYNQLRSLLPSE